MSRITVTGVDEAAMRAYSRSVDGGIPHDQTRREPSTGPLRRRRRPPSLSEQANRTNRIRPWADTWKALKADGRWR